MILNGLPWKLTEIILSFLRLHPSTAFLTLLLTIMATPFLLREPLEKPICRSGSVQHATEEEQRITTNSSKKNKAPGPKWKRCSVMDVSGDDSKIQCCKERYCIRTWNVRTINQGKVDIVKQEMTRVNINILEIS